MKYRRFGRTEESISVFSCGGMRYQHSWSDADESGITSEGQANLEACIDKVFSVGINHIETARGYGTSEIQLATALKDYPRENYYFQTKVTPGNNIREFKANFEKSLKNLHMDYIDFFSIHGINTLELLDYCREKKGPIAQALQWKKEGRIRHLGFSTHAAPDIIINTINTGAFDYINLHWYWVNDLNRPALAAAQQQDMGVFIISPNDKGGHLYNPPARLSKACAPLHPMQFNDLYCLSNPDVHTLSLGVATPSDTDIHLAALKHYNTREELVAQTLKKLDRRLHKIHGKDWMQRWPVGLPEHHEIPYDINVREILRLYTYAKAFDMKSWGKARYNLLGNAGHWFPGKALNNFSKVNWDKVLAQSPFKKEIPDILKETHDLLYDTPKKRLSQS